MVATNPALALCDDADQDRVLADLRTYFGPRAERFLAVYEKMRGRPPNKRVNVISWNWGVFLAPFVWFFYRKQYLLGVMVLLLPIAIGLLFPAAARSGGSGAVVVFAMWANGWYVTAALGRIAKADRLGMAGEARAEYLRRAGGVSTVLGSLSGLVYAALIGLMVLGALAE